jgi:hypothetical protein
MQLKRVLRSSRGCYAAQEGAKRVLLSSRGCYSAQEGAMQLTPTSRNLQRLSRTFALAQDNPAIPQYHQAGDYDRYLGRSKRLGTIATVTLRSAIGLGPV